MTKENEIYILKIIIKGSALFAWIPLMLISADILLPVFLLVGISIAQIFTPYNINTNGCGGTPTIYGNCFNFQINTNLAIIGLLISGILISISIITEIALKRKYDVKVY